MLRFIYYTDPHVRIQSPPYRLDDYYTRILKKMDYVRQLGEKYNVNGYICGGDMLDRPDMPYTTLTGLCEVLEKFKKPHYIVIGNHEEYGYNPDTHIRTALSPIRASGLVTRLSMDNPLSVFDEGTMVQLTGCDAHSELDKNGRVSDYTDVPNSPYSAVKIHVVHGFLAKRPWPQVPVTTIDSILHTKADIILSGHEHSGFGVIEKNDKIFCNPGALGRVTASVGDVNLEVKVALIEIEGVRKKITLIPLPPEIAPPSNEVIDRPALEREQEHKQRIATFVAQTKDAVKKLNFSGGFNIYKLLDQIVLDEGIPKEVEEIMRKYIALSEEELKRGGGE